MRKYVIAAFFAWMGMVGVVGADVTAPLPPPSILKTDTPAGALDMFVKMFPFLWSAFLWPLANGWIQSNAPGWLTKLPRWAMPVVATVFGSIGGLMAAMGSMAMEGGGVAVDTGVIQGGTTAAAAQVALQASHGKSEDVKKEG